MTTRMTDHEFCETFQITSRTGRVYTRAMLLSAASRDILVRAYKVSRAELAALLDDAAWLRRFRGYVPRALITELAREARFRQNTPQ